MELSAERYAQIVRGLGGSAAALKGHESRRAARFAERARLTIVLLQAGQRQTAIVAQLFNISSRGVGLLHQSAMTKGSQFLARMNRDGNAPVEILCSVAHCRQLSKNVFAIGAEFVCVVSQSDEGGNSEVDARRIRESILG